MNIVRKMAAVIIGLLAAACLYTNDNADSAALTSALPCRCDNESPSRRVDGGMPGEAKRGGTIHVRIDREPNGLLTLVDPDPLVASLIDHNVLESLVRTSAGGEAVEPELASSFAFDEETNTYNFRLDPRARWHDGKKVTSHDVAFVISKLTDPDKQSIFGGALAGVAEVRAPDESTIEIRLDRPQPGFLFTLAGISIVPQHVYGRTPLAMHPASRAPVGSGPFRFVRWLPAERIDLERNHSWRGEPPFADKICFHIVKDDRVALDLFSRGDLDIVAGLGVHQRPDIKGARWIDYLTPTYQAWLYNTARPVFARPQVRRAMAKLIDRSAIRCSILRCRAELIDSPWPPTGSAQKRATSHTFDPKGARRILESDGWRDKNRDGVRERRGIDLSFSLLLADPGRDIQRTATVVQEDLRKAGIAMKITAVNRGAYERKLREGDFDAAVVTLSLKPMFDGWSLFHSDAIEGGENFGSFSDANIDLLIEKLQITRPLEERRRLTREISARLDVLQPMSFVFRPFGSLLVRRDIGGIAMRGGWFEQRSVRRLEVKP